MHTCFLSVALSAWTYILCLFGTLIKMQIVITSLFVDSAAHSVTFYPLCYTNKPTESDLTDLRDVSAEVTYRFTFLHQDDQNRYGGWYFCWNKLMLPFSSLRWSAQVTWLISVWCICKSDPLFQLFFFFWWIQSEQVQWLMIWMITPSSFNRSSFLLSLPQLVAL